MTRRSVLGAIVIVTLGLVVGAGILSGLGEALIAGNTGRTFNSAPLYTPSEEVGSLNDAFTRVAEIVTPQVVYINVKSKSNRQTPMWPFSRPDEQQEEYYERGSGSGIIITTDGYIITNNHVVEGATDDGITVTLNDSREFEAELIGADKNTDIAVIKIPATDLAAASLGNSDEVKVGEWVLAVGNPLGLTSTVTAGIVSAISRNVNLNMDSYAIENFIQTDAAVNPGNSGGALVNLKGQVIGVNTAIATGGGFSRNYIGYSFAVPINLAKTVANGIIKNGRFVRGFIGISITTLDASRAKALGMDTYEGVFVESIQPDGAGEDAGIVASDVVVEVNGHPVRNASELQARVGVNPPGTVIKLKVFRDGEYIMKDVTLKGKDGETTVAALEKPEEKEEKEEVTVGPVSFDEAGFTVKDLDSKVKSEFKVDDGVLVTDVKRFGKAYENNLRAGTVILEAKKGSNVTKIKSVKDLQSILKKLGPQEAILLRIQDATGRKAFIALEGPVS